MRRYRWLCVTAAAAVLALLLSLFLLPGCGKSKPATGEEGKEEAEAQGEQETAEEGTEAKTVTLTLYFIKSEPSDMYLVAQKRTIPYTTAVARAAMEELIKGPSGGDGLIAAFPGTVKVLDVSIRDGVCTVNLSKEILTDKAKQGGAGAAMEGLALISIANTLTEFPTIQKVKLLIEGKQSGQVDGFYVEDFWGHVGLPEYLERNMAVVRNP
ncbi:GerMN domain-containing protein [Candidatus Solincola tengchongensis]|uniref:GerMN domain-containing protein n=1 Tax=Candidatus Solincola tengchongensis TaxID=2900693 RepID=UPI00257CE25E|nr:GerMN domain-containing protein [Candidatus Solincola tengchongensis]